MQSDDNSPSTPRAQSGNLPEAMPTETLHTPTFDGTVGIGSSSTTSSDVFDDDITEINLEDSDQQNSDRYVSRLERNTNSESAMWTAEEERAYEAQRRQNLIEELDRIQRTNFIHFGFLCSIPLCLLGLVLINSFRSPGECESIAGAECHFEGRFFINAFSKRCLCNSIQLEE
eukprot:CAMPEP_0204627716 /NCGR_PEP_ID=MMETSP0717-20131115/14254_1 /ASSEMBLY_ACC=CAM_ASM_000666 /TAXON_ID=230516 /ORGANISM="Chaetoceros curvisetus" /LENGTH=172 /DNA_ID=CAMNT_0051644061 /DNA_START=12 /DNA_END=530 /DNA_ORIENTATION=+